MKLQYVKLLEYDRGLHTFPKVLLPEKGIGFTTGCTHYGFQISSIRLATTECRCDIFSLTIVAASRWTSPCSLPSLHHRYFLSVLPKSALCR